MTRETRPAAGRAAQFDPMGWLERQYSEVPRLLACDTSDTGAFAAWQGKLRQKLRELLGEFPWERVPLRAEVVERRRFEGYTRERVIYDTAEGISVPAYVLVPEGSGPFPAVVALHGHGYGKDDIVGIERDGSERTGDPGYQKDFAVQLVRRGLVTIAPEQACFGERRDAAAQEKGTDNATCRKVSMFAQMIGKTALGMRVYDVMRTLDYLTERADADAARMACMGISGGGMSALFSAALDDRLQAAVVSGYFNTFYASIMSLHHCECNYVPGLAKFAEMYDVAALVPPRPFLIENGIQDSIFPIDATRAALAQLRQAYDLLGVPERLAADIFDGKHQISGALSYDWLAGQLQAKAA